MSDRTATGNPSRGRFSGITFVFGSKKGAASKPSTITVKKNCCIDKPKKTGGKA